MVSGKDTVDYFLNKNIKQANGAVQQQTIYQNGMLIILGYMLDELAAIRKVLEEK